MAGQLHDVAVVVFDPASYFLIIHKLDDDGDPILRQPVDVFGFSAGGIAGRGPPPPGESLPAISFSELTDWRHR